MQSDQRNTEGGADAPPVLDKPRHIKYWLRNLKTLLPYHYTGNESNRMYLAFFILNALDLLSSYEPHTSESERQEHLAWIYHCQHPDGGFRMWPGTDFGPRASAENARWDPANLPATYFALASLLVLGDDLKRVKRRECLGWIRRLQRADGSFGETIIDQTINGGRDPRLGYCAMGARYILRGGSDEKHLSIDDHAVPDVDLNAFVRCIREGESFDGGIADERFHEPHAGYTYCAVAALHLAGRLQALGSQVKEAGKSSFEPSRTLEWLVQQQTAWIDPDSAYPTDGTGHEPATSNSILETRPPEPLLKPQVSTHLTPNFISDFPASSHIVAGFAGRPNKPADTCYAWWVCGALALLPSGTSEGNRAQAPSGTGRTSTPSSTHLFSAPALRHYLLDVTGTQHPVLGGFGKSPGDPPDLYHSYLGLAVLGLLANDGDGGADGVKQVDGAMCISAEAKDRVAELWP